MTSVPDSAKFQAWEDKAQNTDGDYSKQSLSYQTLDGISIKALYTVADLEGIEHVHSFPGFSPYVRGPQATMYVTRPWTIRQYAGFSTAQESNRFYKSALAGGMQGISVAFDLPTHRGYDSDHPRVFGDAGKAGVAIDSVEDMKVLFDGIDLGKVSVSMTMNGAVLPIMATYIVAALEQGRALSQLTGTVQNDILKEFLVRNTYIYPPSASMRIVSDIIQFTSAQMPRFNSISISGYHLQEAGATTCTELAFTLSNGREYIRAALAAGLKIDEFAPRLSFFFAVGMDFYQEVAKLRAARKIWHDLVAAFAPNVERSKLLRTHCQTSGWSLSAQDPNNNVVRTTIEAMAAVFGGTQSLHTNSFDEAVSLPTPNSARLARNTQLILQEECHLTSVVDPWGGSFMMERLTQDIIDKTLEIMQQIENNGGMIQAIESGWAKQQIEQTALIRQARIDDGTDVIVGSNKYQLDNPELTTAFKVDNRAVLSSQQKNLVALKKGRDPSQVSIALGRLRQAAMGQENLLEFCIGAAKARATVGEMSQALEQVFGRHQAAITPVSNHYGSEFADKAKLDVVVERVKQFALRFHRAPSLLVAKLGQDGHDRGAAVVASAFSSFGFQVNRLPLFLTPEEVAGHAIEQQADAIGISSLVAAHNELVPELLNILRTQGAPIAVFVGGVIPEEDHPFLLQCGVHAIYGPGTVLVDAAIDLLDRLHYCQESGGPAKAYEKAFEN